jgi:hypothetical protein
MTSEEITAIRAYCDAATPGPWYNPGLASISLTFDQECNIYPPDTTESHGFQFGGPVAVVKYRGECDSNPDGADADFISRARTDLPRVLDELEKREKRIAELEALVIERNKVDAYQELLNLVVYLKKELERAEP